MVLIPELAALTLALSVYTLHLSPRLSALGSRQCLMVNRSGTFAGIAQPGYATPGHYSQALRVIIPPLTSQYLNIVKNPLLPPLLAIPIWFRCLLAPSEPDWASHRDDSHDHVGLSDISLTISLLMNIYNRRIAIVDAKES